MEIINSIQIRKFRSIKSATRELYLTHLNVFVGQNDKGKSNILRALNLFFNNETDKGQTFRFEDDYCYHSETGKGTRHEIRIDLVITPPKKRFKHAKPLKWTKHWRKDGSVTEERLYIESGKTLLPKDNIFQWLDKIRYRYVPAIKGQSYFSSLMGELHDVLNESHAKTLHAQGEYFISGIQKVTNLITEELFDRIKIPNTIQVPSNFKQLFSNLDFGVKEGENTYHLKQRGDGIKIRHIPVILKFMSEQERNISRAGYVKPDTIWGFEEPENNLELKYAFELAKDFKTYAKDIQILVTTHSPAFYSLGSTGDEDVNAFYISQDKDCCTCIERIDQSHTDEINNKMGLLPIITPYLEKIYESQRTITELQNSINRLKSNTRCIVLTEDSKQESIKTFLEMNNFHLSETELFSYEGAANIPGAILLAEYLKNINSDITIVIHRDRDYLTDSQVESLSNKITKKGAYPFITTGVDIESIYINSRHIHELYPELAIGDIEKAIDEATNDSSKDSTDRLINHFFGSNSKPPNSDYAEKFHELLTLYNSDKCRYRYGKKVLGVLCSKLQILLKKNPAIQRKTNHIKSSSLTRLSGTIWN
jgi:energy-coupling factor transporter ATP-binding protein EcfA2